MEIKLSILDSEGTELQMRDVVLVEYTNPKEKYIGVIDFDKEIMQLVVSDNDGGWHAFPKHSWETIRVLGDEGMIPTLEKYFGRSEFKNPAAATAFIKKIEKLIHNLF